MNKKCFKCGKIKDIDQFYVHKQMGDGHLGKCKTCTKKDVSERYKDPVSKERIKEYERKRFQNPERKKKVIQYQLNRRHKYRGKEKARRMIGNYIRSEEIIRKPCEVCGELKSQAHHEDYRKPLEVRWLCFKHHRIVHGQKL
jgi:hypothetical protein